MKITKISTIAAAIALFAMAMQANATTISFTNWIHNSGSDASDYVVTVNDDNAGYFLVNVDVSAAGLASDPSTDILGVFFNAHEDLLASNINNFSANVGSVSICVNGLLSSCGNGNNLNGLGVTFDIGMKTGSTGSGDGALQSFSFRVDSVLGITLSDFDLFGIRAQSTGTGNGSDKAYSGPSTSVPEPSTLALFGLGLLGIAFATTRRRKTK